MSPEILQREFIAGAFEERRFVRLRRIGAVLGAKSGKTKTLSKDITRLIRWALYRNWSQRTFTLIAAQKKTLVKTMSNTARARVYSDVNVHRPREYWDYESHVIEWG